MQKGVPGGFVVEGQEDRQAQLCRPHHRSPLGPPHPEGPDLGLVGGIGTSGVAGFLLSDTVTSTQRKMDTDLQSSGDKHLAASPRETPILGSPLLRGLWGGTLPAAGPHTELA